MILTFSPLLLESDSWIRAPHYSMVKNGGIDTCVHWEPLSMF